MGRAGQGPEHGERRETGGGFLRETLLVAGESLRQSLRSTRALLLLGVYGLVSLASLAAVTWVTRRFSAAVAEMPTEEGAEAVEFEPEVAYRQFLEVMAGDPEQAVFLAGIPPIVLLFFWMNHAFLPWLAVLVGYDQVGGDVQSGAVRFLLLRVERGAILAGRLLANLLLLAGLTGAVALAVLGYGALFVEDFETGVAAGHLVRFWVLVFLLGLAWLSITCWLSTLFRPYLALLAGAAVLLGGVVLGWATRIFDFAAALRWVLPNQYRDHLTSHRLVEQLAGAGALLGFTAVFFALSWITFRRRDL